MGIPARLRCACHEQFTSRAQRHPPQAAKRYWAKGDMHTSMAMANDGHGRWACWSWVRTSLLLCGALEAGAKLATWGQRYAHMRDNADLITYSVMYDNRMNNYLDFTRSVLRL